MLTRQLWFGAAAMALMTTAASALPIPMYKVVVLPASSVTNSASAGTAAITGLQGGVFELGRYYLACSPLPDPTACTASRTHAVLWTQNGTHVVGLNPRGYFSTALTGMTTSIQVGFGYKQKPDNKQQVHALAWLGSAQSMIDLNPVRYQGSMANGVDGFRIIGTAFVRTTNPVRHQAALSHAFMWIGMDSTREMPTHGVDLNPPGYNASEGFAAANGYEVGYASNASGRHAYIWKGTATSGRDYHPAGYSDSYILGINGSQAVGAATESKNGGAHAYVWYLQSAVFGVDLHGSGFVETVAAAVAGGRQVGWGERAAVNGVSSYHALVWRGTANSCIDLHAFLPRGYISSKAVAIAPDGSIVGVAIDSKNVEHAVLWVPQH